jgi:hypothetical protein
VDHDLVRIAINNLDVLYRDRLEQVESGGVEVPNSPRSTSTRFRPIGDGRQVEVVVVE